MLHSEQPTGVQKLRRAFWSFPRPMHLVLMLICFLLGVALASQVISQREDPFERLSQQDLVVLLEEMNEREEELRSERAVLAEQLAQLENEATRRSAAKEAAEKARIQSQINAGLLPVKGPGVEIEVNDSQRALRAAHFVMTIGELRNAGAESVELNGQRLTMRSFFTTGDDGIYVDGKRLVPPYRWKVIGESQTIATALEIPGGAASQMKTKGASVSIKTADEVRIDVIATPVSTGMNLSSP